MDSNTWSQIELNQGLFTSNSWFVIDSDLSSIYVSVSQSYSLRMRCIIVYKV